MNPKINSHPVVRDFFWLTRYTNPYGTEAKRFSTLLSDLGARKDDHGNFILDVGESRTVFASHLDTASYTKMQRVRRVVDGDLIKSDGKTILGADDRAGIAVMLHLIRNEVPGRYVFFVGEERGRIGSEKSARKDADMWRGKYDRMIMWDRYGMNSIITHQMGTQSASDTFAETLAAMYTGASSQLEAQLPSIYLKPDDNGMYTDSYSFIDLIPECTNISVGYMSQHTTAEQQDARFLIAMAETSVQIAWEDLPTAIDINHREEEWDTHYMPRYGAKAPKNLNSFSPYTIINDTLDDVIEAAVYGTLTRSDVREFILQSPEDASELLYDYLTGGIPW